MAFKLLMPICLLVSSGPSTVNARPSTMFADTTLLRYATKVPARWPVLEMTMARSG